MAYEPLHHKYRPQTFADLVGQTAIATTLCQALEQRRIAPAYLFCGPRGTGKTSSARILAKSLNCVAGAGPTATPCGRCETCRAIAAGSALDVIEIDAASNTGVDNIRELIERAQFAPVQCRFKVYVVDECHMLSTAAFNALLKTLEEPPDRVVFVLATTDPQRVLPTIISRCQRFDFRRIPLEAMSSHLRRIADIEQIGITDEAIALVAQIAQGGLRDAESLLDQLGLLPPPVSPEAVWDLVGAVPERDLFALVQAIAADDPQAVLEQARHLMNRGREPLIVLQNLAAFYRDLLIARTAPDRPDLTAITEASWSDLCTFARDFELDRILRGQQQLRQAEAQVKNTTQPRLWLEITLLGLLPASLAANAAPVVVPAAPRAVAPAVPSSVPPSGPVAATPTPTVGMAATSLPAAPVASVPVPEPPPAAVSSVPPTSDPDLPTVWSQALNRMGSMRGTQMLLQQQGQLLRIEPDRVVVGVTAKWLGTLQLRQEAIASAFSQVLGRPLTLQFDSQGTAAAPSPAAPVPLAAVQPLAVAPPRPVPRSVSVPPAPVGAAPPVTPPPAPATPELPGVPTVSVPVVAVPESTLAPVRLREAAPAPDSAPSPPVPRPAAPDVRAEVPGDAVAAPSVTPTAPASWQDPPALKAARSLAQFFNGQLVEDAPADAENSAATDD